MKTKQLDKQSFETLIWEMQQTISRMDQLIKKYEKRKKKVTLHKNPTIGMPSGKVSWKKLVQ